MSLQYYFEIAYETETASGVERFRAPNRNDAERQFCAWWDFKTDWTDEKTPVPSHWCVGMWSEEDAKT